MNSNVLFLFIILFFSLLLCSFLGGNTSYQEGLQSQNKQNLKKYLNNKHDNNNDNNSSSYFGGNNNSNDPQAQAIEQIADAIKANADKINDALLLDKYKSNYEDIIINLESVVTNTMLSSLKPLALAISKDPTSQDSQTAMVGLENLNKFPGKMIASLYHQNQKFLLAPLLLNYLIHLIHHPLQ